MNQIAGVVSDDLDVLEELSVLATPVEDDGCWVHKHVPLKGTNSHINKEIFETNS